MSCVNFLGVPTMCAVINETTRTVRIETIVTNIVERIVEKEVVTEVPIEQIVRRVETQYIVTGREVDIEEIVKYVIERIAEYVQPDDLIDVPTDVIVDETTDYITNPPPPNQDKEETTLGGIRDETLTPIPIPPSGEDKEETRDPNSEDGGTEGGTEGGGTDGSTPPENIDVPEGTDGGTDGSTPPENIDVPEGTDGGTDGSTPPENIDVPEGTDGGTDGSTPPENIDVPEGTDGGTEGDRTPWTPEDVPTVRLQVSIGPKKMDSPPSITQPGLTGSVTCQIEGNTVHPGLYSYSVFTAGSGNQWGVEFWCEVPADIDDSHTTIHVNVNDFERWCGLTTEDIRVSKFNENNDRSLRSIGSMNALIKLSPNPVPVCPNAPVFTEGTDTTRSVAENTASGVDIGDPVSATDSNNDTLEYTLDGTDASAFSIDSDSGQLKTSAALDYETKDTYLVSVSADDGELTNTIAVTINITDVNEAPMFTEGSSTTRFVAENTSSGQNIGAPVSATDPDNDTLEYTLSGTDASAFSIDSDSGQLKTSAALDYETKDIYSVSVSVGDDEFTDTIAVTINVTDVNEAPMFTEGSSATRSIAENTSSGQNIGAPVSATDPDNDTLEYTLSGTDASAFSIVRTSGQLKTSAALDYETKPSYSVSVSVSDNNGGTDEITVTITVDDVNENRAPVFTEGATANRVIVESAASGTDIGDPVEATDPDNDTLEYTLSGTDASSFSINSDSGQLSTNTTLDYDTKSSYSVTVSVSDGNGGTDEITVTITVLEAYIPKQEFFEVYYAINLDSGYLDVQCYTIRGYGYDDGTPIYVDNYYKFEDGSPEQTSTGWGSDTEEGTISHDLETGWKQDYPEEFDYVHASTTVSVHDRTADEARGMIYQTICSAASNIGTWDSYQVGLTYPNIANNTSNDVIDLDTILTYLGDDDCNPDN